MKNSKPRNQKKKAISIMWLMTLILMITWIIPPQSYSSGEEVSQDEATHLIRQAADSTDEAWEEFHTAAIEGTLASPLTQMTIEGQLHEIRALLMQARIAKRSQNYQSVKKLTLHIQRITKNIIQESRERKL